LKRHIQTALLDWFRSGHREMPWRATRDPYAIWISEIMLQQTQVETVRPYYQRWMTRFPTVDALADSPLEDVLACWAGLGYYARARNLHAAAQEVQAHYGGRFPSQPEQIRELPGIGPYTAGAIASIAFGLPEPILDGNVGRVLQRVHRLAGAPDDKDVRKRLWALAAELVPEEAAGDFNQSMMELGATVCTPRAPACDGCPLRTLCAARRHGDVEAYPAPKQRKEPRRVDQVTVVLERQGRVLMVQRPARGLWGGLWEPPTGEQHKDETPAQAAVRVARETTGLSLDRLQPLERFEHLLTHRRMRFAPFRAAGRGRLALSGYQDARWMPLEDALGVGVAAWTTRLFSQIGAS
jgi:A/G-specific adenine glycosylase